MYRVTLVGEKAYAVKIRDVLSAVDDIGALLDDGDIVILCNEIEEAEELLDVQVQEV